MPPPPSPVRTINTPAITTVKIDLSPRKPSPICPTIVVYGVEGFGKTTIGAYAPDPVILMARSEQGYDTLLSAGRVPAVPAILIESWEQLLVTLDAIAIDTQGRKSIVFDALGGFERLCHELVCKRDFQNDWSDRGFLSYNKGFDVSVSEWLKMLRKIEIIRARGVVVVMLGHSKVKMFKNPSGPDFERYICDLHEKTWGVTSKWADAVLFGNFRSLVDVSRREKGNSAERKGKGIGGTDRVIYADHRDAFDAKNRFGMPEEFDLPTDPSQAWLCIWNNIVTK